MLCKHCNKPLNEAQYRIIHGKKYKSCPRCSTTNGSYHVYYSYPESFGTTPARSSSGHPDGPQSYCVPCRGESTSPCNGITCDNI